MDGRLSCGRAVELWTGRRAMGGRTGGRAVDGLQDGR